MATLYISYYGSVDNYVSGDPLFVDVVTTSTTSAQGTANTKGAKVASLFSDTAHYYAIGSNPTAAVTNGAYLPANTLVWLDMTNNLADKIAARTLA